MGLGDWFRRMLGGQAPPPPQAPPPTKTQPKAEALEPDDVAFRATCEARDRYWSAVGTVEPDVITYLISPAFMGGPQWPTTRQAFRIIRTPTSIILATDGLADPFDGVAGTGNGFSMELFIETRHIPTEFAGKPGQVDPLKSSWAFALLQNIAEVVADAGGVTGQLDQFGVLSVESPGAAQSPPIAEQLPARFIAGDDVGMLLGGPAPPYPPVIPGMPLSPVRVVPIVLLTAAELDYVRNGGGAARRAVLERLAARPDGHMSDLQRDSVV